MSYSSLSRLALPLLFLVALPGAPSGKPTLAPAASWSTGETLRIDINHFGNNVEEHFDIALLRREGEWPGSEAQFLDTLNLGDYLVAVSDAATNLPLYTRGVDFDYDADSDAWTTSYDCIRVPFPKHAIRLSLRKRKDGQSAPIWIAQVDPDSPAVEPTLPVYGAKVTTLLKHGLPKQKADVVIIGDGYTRKQELKFLADARRAVQYLFDVSPYRELRHLFNVHAVFVPSEMSGITSPLDAQWRRTVLDVTYNHKNIERELAVRNIKMLRDIAATVPYEFIIVLANSRRYGGMAILNTYTVLAVNSKWAPYLVPHEFAHQFGGLADEYFTLAACNKNKMDEPWKPNVTAETERTNLKWRKLIAPSTPVPTPWDKAAYEEFDARFAKVYFALREAKAAEDKVDALIDDTLPKAVKRLQAEKYGADVGAFEGAKNQACGLYRPQTNCTMFTLVHDRFCAVCSDALQRAAEFYAR